MTAFGMLMATATLLVMLIQFQFLPGVFLDLRYTLLAVTAFFGGPIAVLFPFAISVVRRLYVGGEGIWVAIPQIGLATSFGLFGYYRFADKLAVRSVAMLSGAVVFSATVGFFVMVPFARWAPMIQHVVAPFGAMLFVSTLFSGLAIATELKRKRLVEENRIYRAVFEALPDCLNAKDVQGRFIAANSATAALMGAAGPDEMIGKSDFDYYPEDVAVRFRYDEKRQRMSNQPLTVEQKFVRADGQDAWLSTLKAPLKNAGGAVVGVITHNREITAQKQLELRLAETRRHLADALACMADGLAMFDADDTLLFCNTRYQTLFPLTADVRIPGAKLQEILTASFHRQEALLSKDSVSDAVHQAIEQLRSPGTVRQIKLLDGRWIEARSEATASGGYLIVFANVTAAKDSEEKLQELNRRLLVLANTDQLTELPNRRAFEQHLDAALFDASLGEGDVSLLMIDVDLFKSYNDAYGHVAGDEALQRVARCVEQVVADLRNATVSRYGGEEFAVVLPHQSEVEAHSVARLLCSAVRGLGLPHLASHLGVITISVGVASLKFGGSLIKEDLIRNADEALYAAKASGRDRVGRRGECSPQKVSSGPKRS
jgi:diguanylate cyclase (GGDEF)-like protein/PAS domain S-box-containing protein